MQPIDSIAHYLIVMLTICTYASAWTPLSFEDQRHTATPNTIKLTQAGNPTNPTAARAVAEAECNTVIDLKLEHDAA
jgi:site-specific DNA-cytosine methylase